MKKKLFFKLFIFAVIGTLVTFTSCKDYDDDIDRLDADLTALKSSALEQADLTALQTQLTASINAVQTELNTAKATLAALQGSAATTAQIDAAKAEVLAQVVKLESFNNYKTLVDGQIASLRTDLDKAATKEEVAALQTLLQAEITSVRNDLGAKIANLEAILEVVDGKSEAIADIYSQLDDQLTAIEKNKTDIETTKNDLQTKYNELNAAIDALKGRVTNLEDGLAGLNDKVDQIKIDTDKAISDLAVQLNSKVNVILNLIDNLDKSVTSLTFIPDFTSLDGTPQLPVHLLGEWYKPDADVENWDPNLSDEKDLTPYKGITYAKFHVNPSNATLNDFEVVGLLQKTSEILVRSTEEPLLKVVKEDVTLSNGILTVPILVHEDLYNMEDFESNVSLRSSASPDDDNERMFEPTFDYDKNISIALEVKNKKMEAEDGEERLVVSSQYVRTQISLLFSRIELIDEEGDLGVWENVLPSHMSDDIALDTYYKPSASIKLWNGYNRTTRTYDKDYSINLNDSLQAIAKFNDNWRLLEEFGYDDIEDHFVFELIDVVNEGVNQSSYVTLNGATGVIKVKAGSNGNANQAAVGRTPIVLVKVVKNGKVYAAGYLKIVITEEVDNSPIKFAFTLEDYTLDCNSQYQLTDIDLQNIDFDQIFDHERVMLGKDAFFTAYRQNPIETEVVSYPSLATGDEISFEWNVDEPTQGGSLANYIKGTIENTAPAGTYVVKTTLTGEGTQPDIIITWTVTVKLPTISINANTAILSNGKIVVNPTILQQGAKTSTAYEALLNNAFMHQADKFIYTGLTEACEDYLTPYFVFTSAPEGYVIADNGTTLRLGEDGPLAARIIKDGRKYYIRLNKDVEPYPGASWGNYPPLSNAAKGLVGKTVSVQPKAYINGATWNVINLYNAFNVEFISPLRLNLPQDAAVYDQANNGKNIYKLNVNTILVDWLGSVLRMTTSAGQALYDHYEVGMVPIEIEDQSGYTPFVFDLDNIKCNINGEGQIVEAITYSIPNGMSLKISGDTEGSVTWTEGGVSVTTPTKFTLKWDNSVTGAIQNEFKIAVPVKVTHKWGVLNSNLVITVKPGSGPAAE